MKNILNKLVQKGKCKKQSLTTIRVKLHTSCQWNCYFCHMEGNCYSTPIDNLSELMFTIERFRNKMGINEVHFTGGEPSIYSDISSYVKKVKQEGFKVKMTTNGVTYSDRYLECIENGLSGINISIHTLDPNSLANMMEPIRSVRWGKKTIATQLSVCKKLSDLVDVKINTCVGLYEKDAIKIAKFSKDNGIRWRAMDQLGIPDESYATLSRMSTALGALPVEANLTIGSSSFSLIMKTYDGFTFKIKLIRPFKLMGMCHDCPLEQVGECYEYVYGPRIEKDAGELKIRNCLHRHKKPFVLSSEEFFQHRILSEYQDVLGKL